MNVPLQLRTEVLYWQWSPVQLHKSSGGFRIPWCVVSSVGMSELFAHVLCCLLLWRFCFFFGWFEVDTHLKAVVSDQCFLHYPESGCEAMQRSGLREVKTPRCIMSCGPLHSFTHRASNHETKDVDTSAPFSLTGHLNQFSAFSMNASNLWGPLSVAAADIFGFRLQAVPGIG